MSIRPKGRLARWVAGELPFEVLLALVAAGNGLIAGIKSLGSTPPDYSGAWMQFSVAAVTCILLVWRAFCRNRKAQKDEEVHALEGALDTLYAILTHGKDSAHGLRICVCVPKSPTLVHQVTNYVSSEPPYGVGRDNESRCGVVGVALRTGTAQYGKLPKNMSLADYLVQQFGYERREAGTMRQDRKSWAAMPVGVAPNVEAVIFLDSAEVNFFGNGNSPCRRIIEAATVGVANFIART